MCVQSCAILSRNFYVSWNCLVETLSNISVFLRSKEAYLDIVHSNNFPQLSVNGTSTHSQAAGQGRQGLQRQPPLTGAKDIASSRFDDLPRRRNAKKYPNTVSHT